MKNALSITMTHDRMSPSLRLAGAVLGSALMLAVTPAMALYKVVGPDGKVTYTDRPPTDRPIQSLKTNGGISNTDSLPFELRQVSTKFPVTLYTSPDCDPCDQGRRMLQSRGIPFTEKSVITNADIQALQRLEGSQQVPVLRIGKQPLQGFNDADWVGYLDAAGYPKQSALPRTYRYQAATPLVPEESKDAGASIKATPVRSPRAAARSTDNNAASGGTATPPGFRF